MQQFLKLLMRCDSITVLFVYVRRYEGSVGCTYLSPSDVAALEIHRRLGSITVLFVYFKRYKV